ncbi:DHA2 family efflux MFS transporter permease subunit [Paenibacillus sp. HB172176]|uniref:DHA2 family efflux MFS transporter permease subunit n=1 Tax=Paenibacillus sp. HB172176 TaxID=2493690 RepID=UPI001439F914|nr:DHA2 family efflux MFS transporter permease subunit [Paenibacillus sp. HB172176]
MAGALNPRIIIRFVYVAAMFLVAMDGTIVNVALLTICKEMGVSPAEAGTVNIGYLVAVAITLPAAGWLGDRFGGKRVLLGAIAVFTAASACCGLASSLEQMVLFRIVQGAAGGLIAPVGMAMLFRAFPPEERAKLSRSLIVPIAVAPAIGPILGGFFVETWSWRWCFYINLPIGIIALLLGWFGLKEEQRQPGQHRRLDAIGLLLSAPGFAMVVYALSQGSIQGWDSPGIIRIGAAGMLLLAVMVIVELRVKAPMLQLRLLGDRLYRTTGLIALCSAAGLLGMLYVFPLMYQDIFGASPLHSGLTTFPEALGLMAASQCLPWSLKRIGSRRVIQAALLGAMLIFGMLSLVQPTTSPWLIRLLLLLGGFTLGHSVGAVQLMAFARIEPPSMGQATMLFQMQNRLGSALGVAMIGSVLAAASPGAATSAGEAADANAASSADAVTATTTAIAALPDGDAYRMALLAAAAFLLLAWTLSLTLRGKDAAAAQLRQPMNAAAKQSA